MSIRKRRASRGLMAEINVVPYIDVMLVLLVIFMVTAPLLTQGVNVNLPQASAKALNQPKEPIVVSVDANGRYFLNIAANPAQPISAQDLTNEVSTQLQSDQRQGVQQNVLVKGDAAVDYGKVMTAMVLLQQAGASDVGLVTQPPANNSNSG